MARKRARKKDLKKRHQVRDRAEDLYLRGEDAAFLELIAEVDDLAGAGLADAYREVVDRSLLRALGEGDVAALERVLRRPRAGVDQLPSVRLAGAVVDLDAGRLDRARARLEALATGAEDGGPVPRRLAASLRALCDAEAGDATTGEAADAALADFLKLRRTFDRYAEGDLDRLPGNLRLDEPHAKATLDFVRALETLGRTPRPKAKALAGLRRTARALLEGKGPGERSPRETSEVLALGAVRFARWLAVADEIEVGLHRRGADREDVEETLDRFRADGDKLRDLFDERTPPALHGLRHLLERRCRAILERLVELSGPATLARAQAAAAGAFDSILESADGEAEERIGKWATTRSLYDRRAFSELARFCARESADGGDPLRLAILWAVELGSLWRATEDHLDDLFDDDFDEDEEAQKQAWRRLAGRLRAISGQLGQRLATPEQRVQVARVLRRQLLDVAAAVDLTEPFLTAAENLLGHLDDDPALLLAALAAATEIRDRSAARRFGERIAARGPAPPADLESLMPFLSPPTGEDADDVVTFLRRAEPLFGEAWPQARATAVHVVEVRTLFLVGSVLRAGGAEVRDLAEFVVRNLHEELDVFRPLFGEERSFQVAELLAEWAFDDASKIRSAVKGFLHRCSDLEAALAALRAVDVLNDAAYGFETARALAIEATLNRLDHRSALWRRAFKAIFPTLDRKQLLLAHNRIQKILSAGVPDETDREQIEEFLSVIEDCLDLFRRRPRRQTTRSRRGSDKKSRRGRRQPRPPAVPSGQLDLFGSTEEDSP